jgi:hypothetical protein
MIPSYLGFTMSAERALADAFVLVGFRHATEPEMLNAARLHSNWCKGHLSALRSPAERYGAKGGREGERHRRALSRGRRRGALVCCGICTTFSPWPHLFTRVGWPCCRRRG